MGYKEYVSFLQSKDITPFEYENDPTVIEDYIDELYNKFLSSRITFKKFINFVRFFYPSRTNFCPDGLTQDLLITQFESPEEFEKIIEYLFNHDGNIVGHEHLRELFHKPKKVAKELVKNIHWFQPSNDAEEQLKIKYLPFFNKYCKLVPTMRKNPL